MTEQQKPDKSSQEAEFEFRLKWPFGMAAPSLYANQFSVTHTGDEVILEFGEFLPTGLSGRTKEEIRDLAQTVEVRPIARIILSPHGLKALANLIGPVADKITLAGEEGPTT